LHNRTREASSVLFSRLWASSQKPGRRGVTERNDPSSMEFPEPLGLSTNDDSHPNVKCLETGFGNRELIHLTRVEFCGEKLFNMLMHHPSPKPVFDRERPRGLQIHITHRASTSHGRKTPWFTSAKRNARARVLLSLSVWDSTKTINFVSLSTSASSSSAIAWLCEFELKFV
jgi:hypothetical protein